MKKIVLVDGSSYLFRAYHALPYLTNSKGEPTGAILGIINMLKKLPTRYKTDYVAVIFDPKGKTFRHDMYPEYKANRKAMDDELRVQIQPLHEIIKKMGFPVIIEDGVEADDVIGTLAVELEKQGHEVVISTGDKDMAQLVTENVTLFDSMKNATTDISMVIEKFGVRPDQIIDYLALMGDSSDNIPGVAKVGPKTAVKWLSEFGNIEGVIENQDEIRGKVGESLRASTDLLRLSYQLATIKCDLELNLLAEDLKCIEQDDEYLAKMYTKYEFNSLLNGLSKKPAIEVEPQAEIAKVKITYENITTTSQLDNLIKKLNGCIAFAFDTETDSLDTTEANLVGMSFSCIEGEAFYIPLQHRYLGVPQQLDLKNVLEKLKPLFASQKHIKIAHNFKFDEKILSKYGVNIEHHINDTMIMAYIIKSSGKHSMDSLSEHYFGITPISYDELAGKGKAKLTLDQIDIEKVGHYAAEDADITFRLYNHLLNILSKDNVLSELYTQVEMPLVIILNAMEKYGVKIDAKELIEQSSQLDGKIKEIQLQCFDLCGQEFNLSSPVQL